MSAIEQLVNVLSDRKKSACVVLTWVVLVALASTLGAFKFSNATANDFFKDVPSYLRTYDALSAFQKNFHLFLSADTELVYIKNLNGTSVAPNDETKDICSQLTEHFNQSKYTAVLSLEHYYQFFDTKLDPLKNMYVNDNGNGMVFVVKLNSDEPYTDFLNDAIEFTDSLDKQVRPAYSVIMTGKLTTSQIAEKATGIGFALSDGLGLPFIIIIFWWMVGSFRMLIIPGAALASSLICSWGVGYALTQTDLVIPSYEPNIMLFLSIALSIDYSFFFLTRFQEERLGGNDINTCVSNMLLYSGSTVMVSGCILVVTWLALAVFPVFGLSAVGYCSAITVFMCIATNVTLCPCIILAMPTFFENAGFVMCSCCKRCKESEKEMYQSIKSPEETERNCYYRLAAYVTKVPGSLILPFIWYIIFALGASELRFLDLSLGANINFGSNPAADAYGEIIQTFNNGIVQTPFAILGAISEDIDPLVSSHINNAPIVTSSYFDVVCELSKKLENVDGLVSESIASIATEIDFQTGKPTLLCLNATQAAIWVDLPPDQETVQSALYQYQYLQNANVQTNLSSLITFGPSFNPFSTRVKNFIDKIRNYIDEVNGKNGVSLWMYHPMCAEVDSEELTAERFPLTIGVVIILVFLVVSIRFRAAIIPFKLFFTIAIPIFFVFGIAVLVFQKGALNKLGWSTLSGSEGGISWLVPCASVFLLIGLALDYDIFLFARVYEMRKSGMTTQNAICCAVEITGPVISGAGIIMALAFSGMLANDNAFLNQFGFIMILGVLLDTFVVRILLVPSILSLGGWLNWWPMKMPSTSHVVQHVFDSEYASGYHGKSDRVSM